MPTTWEILLDIWALEDRPEKYQNEAFVNTLAVETGLMLMAACESQQKKYKGEDTFGRHPTSSISDLPANILPQYQVCQLTFFLNIRSVR
jgi:hypothetical protein